MREREIMTSRVAKSRRSLSLGSVALAFFGCTEPTLGKSETATEVAPDALTAVEDEVDQRFPSAKQLDPKILAEWLKNPPPEGLRIVDVRAAAEYAASHIPGAVHIPEAELLEADSLRQDAAAGRQIVLYCSVGWRSSRAAVALGKAGIAAANLRGSLFRWAIQDHPLVNAKGSTTRVHPYDAEWGRLLPQSKRAARR